MSIETLFLRDDIKQHELAKDPFNALKKVQGQVYRNKEGRKTLCFQLADKSYFLKFHQGIGWTEIIKNWLQLRAPVVGAENEWLAIQFLTKYGIETMSLAGYGQRGANPAKRQSFIITDELTRTISLELLAEQWHRNPPSYRTKKNLIHRLAQISKTMHEKGMAHRDFYLAHFLIDENFAVHNTFDGDSSLFLIDLHRALITEGKPVKQRWLVKDIGSLYFSAMDIVLTRRDLFRFMRAYSGLPLRETLRQHSKFWLQVRQRAMKLRNADNAVVIDSLNPLRPFIKGAETIKTPFNLVMAGKNYHCFKVLRLLPKKRLVIEARSSEQHVVIKLFSEQQKGQQRLNDEYDGYCDAKAAGINIPEYLFAGRNQSGCFSIVYRYLEGAESLLSLPAQQRKPYLADLFTLVARCHQYGIYQDDIHLENFLVAGGKVYLVDLGSIKRQTRGVGLSPIKSLKNLATLVSQFSYQESQSLEPYIRKYYKLRRSYYDEREQQFFAKYCHQAWQRRKRHYLKKQFRNCTMTRYQRRWSVESAFRRDFIPEDIKAFINDIENWIAKGEPLKRGNSATVMKTVISGQAIVIKRYNIKGFKHFLSRSFRASRARNSWRNANLLEFIGVATAKPIGYIETRRFGLRHTAYFICHHVEAQSLDDVYQERLPSVEELQQITIIFDKLAKNYIYHGDMKASNLLLDQHQQLRLIDLDAMNDKFLFAGSARKAMNKDKVRLLNNWQSADQSMQRQLISDALSKSLE